MRHGRTVTEAREEDITEECNNTEAQKLSLSQKPRVSVNKTQTLHSR